MSRDKQGDIQLEKSWNTMVNLSKSWKSWKSWMGDKYHGNRQINLENPSKIPTCCGTNWEIRHGTDQPRNWSRRSVGLRSFHPPCLDLALDHLLNRSTSQVRGAQKKHRWVPVGMMYIPHCNSVTTDRFCSIFCIYIPSVTLLHKLLISYQYWDAQPAIYPPCVIVPPFQLRSCPFVEEASGRLHKFRVFEQEKNSQLRIVRGNRTPSIEEDGPLKCWLRNLVFLINLEVWTLYIYIPQC